MNPRPLPGAGVPSPCINVCRMNPSTGWCEGCGRTIDEIAAWGRLDDDGRRAVWAQLPQRQAQAEAQLPQRQAQAEAQLPRRQAQVQPPRSRDR